MVRRSGLQGDVLKLYRSYLRCVRTKPPEAQAKFRLYTQYLFRHPTKGGGISKRDFTTVEYMLRQGHKTLEMWETGGVNDCRVTQKMRDWSQAERLGRN
ncbi:hypothetical protein M407DRAFT_243488 [Tulasnella calospora MUT 4182]|uniref:Complex 1 LYR protein domain-containing protein n=1 Tax=Tulasnella calospora MUT 4182 TaxID=1051891 RepID=A0A0C3QA31_9AGAM|nr:hypothetical protein M407DRAFT_243488 [Tulasnella calospora MUT 4182]